MCFFIFLGNVCHEPLIPIYGWPSLNEDEWFYSLDECVMEANSQANNHVGIDLICASMATLPNHGEIITQVYIFLIRKTIGLIAIEQCPGCQLSYGSQSEHMLDGCLTPWADLVMLYAQTAQLRIRVDAVGRLYCRLLKKLGHDGPIPIIDRIIVHAICEPLSEVQLISEIARPNFGFLLNQLYNDARMCVCDNYSE